jgi:hypothetical protein
VPVTVQWGPADEKVQVRGNIQNINDKLPEFDQYLIVAQYQLLHISDCWPVTGKPKHPKGSVLSLQVRGGGEMLEIDPTGMTSKGGMTTCDITVELAAAESFNSRIRLSLTEYHIIADRLTDQQLCHIMEGQDSRGQNRNWKLREGTVNYDTFLGEEPGTLLFDTWTLDQTFAPDTRREFRRRWRISCVLKCRQVAEQRGPYPDNCNGNTHPIGWNHDFKRDTQADLGWKFITMFSKGASAKARATPYVDCHENWAPRYLYRDFSELFCKAGSHCEQEDCTVCGGSGGSGGSGGMARVRKSAKTLDDILDDSMGVAARKRLRDRRLAKRKQQAIG